MVTKKARIFTVLLFASALLTSFFISGSYGDEAKSSDPNKLFYVGNNLYEKREYAKAIEEYLKIFDTGIESGDLYYNIGNGFFKLNKLGYAILCYERARRLMPRDSDLRSNLAYARSASGAAELASGGQNIIVKIFKAPFVDFNLNAVAISALVLYVIVVQLMVISMLAPTVGRKLRFALIITAALFVVNVGTLSIRYYDEEIEKHGIMIQKDAECKYEPIDKSTTFYTLHEGDEVSVINTRSGWRQIRRYDGKVAWVKKEAVEEI